MKSRYYYISFLLLTAFFCTGFSKVLSSDVSIELVENIRNSIERLNTGVAIVIGNDKILASNALPLFYERRGFQPVWIDGRELQSRVNSLVNTLKKARFEGLRGEDYHLIQIESLITEIKSQKEAKQLIKPSQFVSLELLLTDAFLVYGSHLLSGKVNPETLNSEWLANRRQTDLAGVLDNAIITNRIEDSLQELLPPQRGYSELRSFLKKYLEIEKNGGWPTIADTKKLRKGDQDSLIISLRARLSMTNDFLNTEIDSGIVFDAALEAALKRFQKRHGLEVDGVMGKGTVSALNIPVSERIQQIEANMERWRWLPQDLGANHMRVDIANYTLTVYENGQNAQSFKVIVGKDYRRTPVFSDKITYMVLAPYWTVPPTIAVKDILPQIKNDIGYLSSRNIRVYSGGSFEIELDPYQIDWSAVTEKNFRYTLRQDPGPINALGDVKFMFPNKFNVYLHDTPSKTLFEKTERAFSSGCIRIEKPLELADYLLRDYPKWNKARIEEILSKRTEYTVKLDKPIPIHILYWTAWVDSDGIMQFRKDLYDRDKPLIKALFENPSINQN